MRQFKHGPEILRALIFSLSRVTKSRLFGRVSAVTVDEMRARDEMIMANFMVSSVCKKNYEDINIEFNAGENLNRD